MEQQRKPKVGEPVVYVDPVNRPIPALVTAVWGTKCVNVVFVALDESKSDTYGRQIERQTSCNHASAHEAPGNYWRYPEDEPKPSEHQQ